MIHSIGSGDAIAAGFAHATTKGNDFLTSIQWGMACGAANVLTQIAGTIRREDVNRLIPQITIEEISQGGDV